VPEKEPQEYEDKKTEATEAPGEGADWATESKAVETESERAEK
jgi:hypothetical protein